MDLKTHNNWLDPTLQHCVGPFSKAELEVLGFHYFGFALMNVIRHLEGLLSSQIFLPEDALPFGVAAPTRLHPK